MAGRTSSLPLALWGILLSFLLICLGGVVAFNVTYLQGCHISNNVTQLWLNSSGLRGPVPLEIGKCTALQVLSLSNNSRVNGSIPPEIGLLTNLVNLDLGSTGLSGPIPPNIGNCTSLQVLRLRSSYKVNGSIPWQIGQLTNLTILDLESTSISGPIPEEIGNLPRLSTLNLAGTIVGGAVPWDALCSRTNLSLLLLNSSKVEGPITSGIGKCTRLKGLSLSDNSKVNGSIPLEIGRLTNLTGLLLFNTNLTSPVPWEALCQLSQLALLNLGSNSRLKGPPPHPCVWNITSLKSLTLSNSPVFGGSPLSLDSCHLIGLQGLYLGSTNLSGTIPPCLGQISGLRALALFGNTLTGAIPSELGSLRNLSILTLSGNRLTGSIPTEFTNLVQLGWLDVHDNKLSGPLPAKVLAGLRQLSILDFSNNSFTGPIPTEIGTSGEALNVLNLGHNNFSAAIPPGLGNLSNLTYLDLSYNQLSGALPVELKSIRPSELETINLAFNNLTGGVDPIGHLTSLSLIYLNNNNFRGPIPTAWFNSSQLGTLSLSFNSFSGPIPSAIRNMRPKSLSPQVLLLLSSLSPSLLSLVEELLGATVIIGLNSNQFSGSFPDIGALNVSAMFNVSDNKLSGTFRAGPFKKTKFTAGFLELSDNGPLELLPGYNLSGLELVSLPNISSQGKPLVAPDMRALRLGGQGVSHSKSLDLTRVPATCPYVSYAQDSVNDIIFWDACNKAFGCVVNLIGTGSKLSRATRKQVCLSKISVFLEGDSPSVSFSVGAPESAFLANQQGSVYFNDSAFVNKLDLGPGGVAYTGVDFSRVQQGNMCRNEKAAEVVGITYGVFAALILTSAAAWWCARALGVLGKTSGKLSPHLTRAIAAGAYFWGIAGLFLTWGDLVSDVQVLVEVWGAWTGWVVLVLILAPFVLSGLFAGRVLLAGVRWSIWEARFKWVPFYSLPDPTDPLPLGALSLWKYPLIPLTFPATVGYIIILDFLDLLDKIGVHLRFGPTMYSFHVYSKFRSQLDLTLRSIPQVVLQTTLYLLGSSRSTRIYIDEQIIFRSVVLSLLNVLVQFNFLAHEHLTTCVPVWTILQRRFAPRNCCATTLSAMGDDEEVDDNEVEIEIMLKP